VNPRIASMYSILCFVIPRQNYKKKMELLAISAENVTFAEK
jgi:hypothetical protein